MTIETVVGGEYPKEVSKLIEKAKKSIDIVVFDWRWYPNDPGAKCQQMNQTISRAIRRGVAVRAIVNNVFIKSKIINAGGESKILNTGRLLHSKLMIIDGTIIITGSHNYTESAFTKNLELSVILNDLAIKNRFNDYFENLWSVY